MWEDYITSMPTIFTCGSFDSVCLVRNPMSFKAGLDESDLYGHLVAAGSLVYTGLCHCPWLIMLG